MAAAVVETRNRYAASVAQRPAKSSNPAKARRAHPLVGFEREPRVASGASRRKEEVQKLMGEPHRL